MILGRESCFSREHLEANKGVAPAALCELVVYSLELVSQLANSGLEFRFKGGNSQLVLLDDPQRFSIDADIVTTVPKGELITLVQSIAAECELFTSCDVRQHKTKPWLPMVSFKLYFNSVFDTPEGDEAPNVMLDAVLEPAPYSGVRKQIVCGDLYSSDETVELPTVSGLIADKLLCLGPATLGIPLGKGKEAQRLKHVFDVAFLSRHDHDLGEVLEALTPCMEQENRIQRSEWTTSQVVDDTRAFCQAVGPHESAADALGAAEAGGYLDEIARGFEGFKSHLFREDYTWARLRADCTQILGLLDSIESAT
jgi:hypothetical protein